jgi:hypothetical protein
MRGIIATLTVLWLAAVTVGAVFPGLFWLSLVSVAGLLVTGAVGVGMILRSAEEAESPDEEWADLTPLHSPRRFEHSGPSGAAHPVSRAA